MQREQALAKISESFLDPFFKIDSRFPAKNFFRTRDIRLTHFRIEYVEHANCIELFSGDQEPDSGALPWQRPVQAEHYGEEDKELLGMKQHDLQRSLRRETAGVIPPLHECSALGQPVGHHASGQTPAPGSRKGDSCRAPPAPGCPWHSFATSEHRVKEKAGCVVLHSPQSLRPASRTSDRTTGRDAADSC